MIRIGLLIPVLLLIVDFALSNQTLVQLTLWPTGIVTELPVSVAALALGGLCFVLGAATTWGGRIAAVARARQAEQSVQQLRAKLAERPVVPPQAGTALSASRMAGTSVAVR